MALPVQIRKDTAAVWSSVNPTLAAGEFGMETDTGKIKIGDGTYAWNSLKYAATTGSVLSPIQRATTTGFLAGGEAPSRVESLETFPFASSTNATDAGDLGPAAKGGVAFHIGNTSSTHGYLSGGQTTNSNNFKSNIRFPLTSPYLPAVSVGDLTHTMWKVGNGASSQDNGYLTGGTGLPGAPTGYTKEVYKFPFASTADTGSSVSQDLYAGIGAGATCSGGSHGYYAGGDKDSSDSTFPSHPEYPAPNADVSKIIQKWSFSSDADGTNVGDLANRSKESSSVSSPTHGYTLGEYGDPSSPADITGGIQKFSFSSDGNGTHVGNLTVTQRTLRMGGGISSTTFGYSAGGIVKGPFANSNVIDRFPFASDAGASDVGDLTQSTIGASGHSI